MNKLLWITVIGLTACSGDKSGTTGTGDTGTPTTMPMCGVTCADYCTTYLGACSADATNEYADQADCEAQCGSFACGDAGATAGDSLECRNYHAGVAAGSAGDATIHCPHAGLNPTDQCI